MTDELRKAGTRQYRRFRTLLIANRGEIAVRVIRTAKAMGLRTVAVYSEPDRDAMHVAMADEAVLLGPERARDSYLNIERVIEAARKSGAEAIHHGYGILTERAEFAKAYLDAGDDRRQDRLSGARQGLVRGRRPRHARCTFGERTCGGRSQRQARGQGRL